MTKTAVVTGAAKNIGKGIATVLIREGYECILLDKDGSALRETARELSKSGECIEYVADVANIDDVNGFLAWLRENNKVIEVLVNNIGYESKATLRTLSREEMLKSTAINQLGPFYITSAIAKTMTHGSIVFITSTHSSVTRMHPLYSSSKAALEMFVKEACLELADTNIRVNAIAPGPVIDSDKLRANKYVPLGYSLQPKDVAEAVAFLVSDKARFITGQTLTVDGGFSVAHTHYWKSRGKL